MDINHYHWVWYLLGFMCVPRFTFMVWLTIYFPHALPLVFMIIGWILAVVPKSITVNK